MAGTKETYQIDTADFAQAREALNFILQRIADRLDQSEGFKANGVIRITDTNEEIIHAFGEIT